MSPIGYICICAIACVLYTVFQIIILKDIRRMETDIVENREREE